MNEIVDISVVQTAPGKEIVIKESNIPFRDAPDWANYYVRNCDGSVTYFEDEPGIEWQHYYCNSGQHLTINKGPKYVPNWRQTIRKRPSKD